jgi:hypothetical protein
VNEARDTAEREASKLDDVGTLDRWRMARTFGAGLIFALIHIGDSLDNIAKALNRE